MRRNLSRCMGAALLASTMALGATLTASTASADTPVPCDPTQSATGCFGPVTCDYERWYPGVDQCGGIPWSISIKEECRQSRLYNYDFWKNDRLCQSFVKRTTTRIYIVKRHNTLWHIALVKTGNGHNWKKIAKANHIKGTLIFVGQRLIIPVR